MTSNEEPVVGEVSESKDIYIDAFLARQELLRSGDIEKIRAHMVTAASSPEAHAKFEGMSDEEWKTAIPYVLNAPLTKETLLAPETEWDIQDTVVKVRIRVSESDTLMSELRKVDGVWY